MCCKCFILHVTTVLRLGPWPLAKPRGPLSFDEKRSYILFNIRFVRVKRSNTTSEVVLLLFALEPRGKSTS